LGGVKSFVRHWKYFKISKIKPLNFLFHTIILFDKIPVYYNIYSNPNGYFAEILDNPEKLGKAADFDLRFENDSWVSSKNIDDAILQVLGEEIIAHSAG
jgi:hypothetical protein